MSVRFTAVIASANGKKFDIQRVDDILEVMHKENKSKELAK
jgi:hypothetical protein